jgi:glycosyltransferase involved in cell wall biosynthesis
MKLSVLVPTYNHGKFIEQMLLGALNQQTNFDYEIVIGDDASTDDAPAIIASYAQRFPDKVRAFLHPQNLGPSAPRELGGKNNVAFLFGQCRGQYIALCEGDDYWTDSSKLQKQVDFLDANPNYALCHHQLEVVYEDNSESHFFNASNQYEDSSLTDLLADESWFLGTASTVFRNVPLFKNFPTWWQNAASGDLGIFILVAQHGRIKYLPDTMAAYRKHRGGMTQVHTPQNKVYLTNRRDMFEAVDAFLDFRYHQIIEQTLQKYDSIIDSLDI